LEIHIRKFTRLSEKSNRTKYFEKINSFHNKNSSSDQYEQLLWTDIYRPRTSKTYLGNHTRQVKRLNEWFSYWTMKLHNEQPKQKKRKRISDEDFDDDSSKYLRRKFIRLIFFHIQSDN
jgi:hypothetical protein